MLCGAGLLLLMLLTSLIAWDARLASKASQQKAEHSPPSMTNARGSAAVGDSIVEALRIAEGFGEALQQYGKPDASWHPEESAPKLPRMAAGLIFQYLAQAPEVITSQMILKSPELNPHRRSPSSAALQSLQQYQELMRPWLEQMTSMRCELVDANAKRMAASGELQRLDGYVPSPEEQSQIDRAARLLEDRWNQVQSKSGRKPYDFVRRARENLIQSKTGMLIMQDASGQYLLSRDVLMPPQIKDVISYVAETYFVSLMTWSLDAGLMSDQDAVTVMERLRAAMRR